ncbi:MULTISPECIES: GlsB/YeaQ/YmgE family stress response membrane protein [Desertihabitans]|uniref:GlsB/YeaQ/YmgE family stress response membrane protein n=1 Tax=Desertihabitans brevis TaxID=2268447 RepID=A0A367YTN4_9ACTN|nr:MULTISPECIES: GlsB/YeaQ/YmgE family stress response membrane protein [Desertihabitans]RCK68889.1 GlsB/YeaQ/YmgE family stress response membrane protein [Desertihabitans brevis]
MGTIIAYIVIGLIGGAIAKLILPGKQGGGWIATIILGIVGALLGGFLGGLLFDVSYSDVFSIQGVITSIVGALIILVIWGLISRRSSARA